MPSEGRFTKVSDLPPMIARRFTSGVFDVVEKLDSITSEKGFTLVQIALAWVQGRPGVTSPIIGPRTMEQLEDNLGALDVVFSDKELAQIDEVVPPESMISLFYEADFGPHLLRCP